MPFRLFAIWVVCCEKVVHKKKRPEGRFIGETGGLELIFNIRLAFVFGIKAKRNTKTCAIIRRNDIAING
jgi:hypothetical protein